MPPGLWASAPLGVGMEFAAWVVMLKWARRGWIVVLVACMALAVWDLARGRSQRAIVERAEAGFSSRAARAGCEDARRLVLDADAELGFESSQSLETGRTLARGLERSLSRKTEGWFERVRVRLAGDVEAIGHAGDDARCPSRVFLPVELELTTGIGLRLVIPSVVTADRRHGFWSPAAFVFPEYLGLYDLEAVERAR